MIEKYEDMNRLAMDALKEIGSIGTGNAATALSQVLSRKIEMTLPEVKIMGYNRAIKELGGAETPVAGVLVQLSGEVNGIMLFLLNMEFIKVILKSSIGKEIEDFSELGELEMSALIEIGNIIISSYINAISTLTGITINLSVPGFSISMLGAILSVPMIEYGYETDKLMTIGGSFICEGEEVYSNLILLPDIASLNFLMQKLGVAHD